MRLLKAGLAAMLVNAACGGANGTDDVGTSQPVDTTAPSTTTASATVSFPNLMTSASGNILPTYYSHLITSSRWPLAKVTIQNPGAAAKFTVTADLPVYGSPTTLTVSVPGGASQDVTISPAVNYKTLFANTTQLPAQVNVSVTSGGTSVLTQSYPIQVSGRDTVFWSAPDGTDLSPLVLTMVTPTDQHGSVAALVRAAAPSMPGGQAVGYQLGETQTFSGTLSPGYYQSLPYYVMQGEAASVTVDSLTGGSNDTSFAVMILSANDFATFSSGGTLSTACAYVATAHPGDTVSCTPPVPGMYYTVLLNPTSNTFSRTFSVHKTLLKWEVTYYQTQAIFTQLRAAGMIYVNLPGAASFFSSAQNVKYPWESITSQSANCIEGALVFASAWEAMGMQPIVLLDLAHGHAFAAVRAWTGSNIVIPVETTMVGGTATFAQAELQAANNFTAWTADGTLKQLDVAAARAAGISPAPM